MRNSIISGLVVLLIAGFGFADSGAWSHLKKGIAAFQKGDYTRAAKYLEAAEKAEPRCFDAAYFRGRIHAKAGQSSAAAAAFRRVPKGHSYFALAQDELGSLLLRYGKKEEALKCLRASAEARPAPSVLKQVVRVELDLQQYKQAEKSIAEASRLAKGDFEVLELRARLFEETDRLAAAVAQYDKLIAKFAGDFRLHYRRGVCLVSLKRKTAAERALQRTLDLNPIHRPAMVALVGLWLDDYARADDVRVLREKIEKLRTSPPKVIRRTG